MAKLTKLYSFSLTPYDMAMIKQMEESGNYLSRSEVVRNAIRLAHKKMFPYYKQIQLAKDAEWEAREQLKKLPTEQYIQTVLPGADIISEPGKVILRHKNNPAWTAKFPIQIVKNFMSRNEVWESVGHIPETEIGEVSPSKL